jgi:hypothetical protein
MHLTYRDSDPHTTPVLPASSGDAGAPASIFDCRLGMDEAHSRILAELEDWDRRFDRPETIAARILDCLNEVSRDREGSSANRSHTREGRF